jgi:hypothetical protein
MKKLVILLLVAVLVTMLGGTFASATVGSNADIDFSSSDLSGYGQEGANISVVDGHLQMTENGLYNALYFGEFADNIVYEFQYRPDAPASNSGEYWGGCSLRCGPSGRYDIGLTRGVNHQSRVRIWKAGTEVAYNISTAVGRGVPDLAPQEWSTVKVALAGGNIKVYVNDMLVIDYTDATPFTEGGFGLRAYNAPVSYDNVKFYPLSSLSLDPMHDYAKDFSDSSFLAENPFNGPPFFDPDSDAFEIVSGELRSAYATGFNAVYFGAGQDTGVMEYRMKLVSGAGVGGSCLNSWSLNGGERYDIAIGSGAQAVTVYKGSSTIAGSADESTGENNPTLVEGTWYNVKIVRDGDTFKVYINDVLSTEFTDATPLNGGYYGFRTFDSIVAYDDLSVYSLADLNLDPAAFLTPTSSPNPQTSDNSSSPVAVILVVAALAVMVLLSRRSAHGSLS